MPVARHDVILEQQFALTPDACFAWFADHDNLGAIFGAPVKRIRAGKDGPNGVGSVRRIGPPVVGLEETTTVAEPGERIEYRVTRNGGPIQNHLGVITFTPENGGTALRWHIGFDSPPVLGPLLERLLQTMIGRNLRRQAARS